jgi:D-glycero-D-manno-heptose 1,7-bisphosphate phosphatase
LNRAVFLDRDGTLIKEKGFLCRFEDVEIFPFAVRALKIMRDHGFRLIVVTNQSAIARGICTESQVITLHRQLAGFFEGEEAVIDAFYYSPFHEDAPLPEYRKKDESRKPEPGMILRAADDFGIDLKGSYMIGDSARDIEAGRRAECRTVLVLTGKGVEAQGELKTRNLFPDWVAADLLEAARMITGHS